MAAYDYRMIMQELDDVQRLLPREILDDIGIINPAEQRLLDVVEDLAAHLANVLGGAATKKTPCHHPHPQANASHGRGLLGERDAVVVSRRNNVQRVVVAPPFLPVPAAMPWPWRDMDGCIRNNTLVLNPAAAAMPIFAPGRASRPLAAGAQPRTMRRGAGTGVLPRSDDVVCHRAKAARSPSNSKRLSLVDRGQKALGGHGHGYPH